MIIVKRYIFLASRRAALGRLRDLPILTLRLPFSIAFFFPRASPGSRARVASVNERYLPACRSYETDESDTEINASNYAARRVTVGGAVRERNAGSKLDSADEREGNPRIPSGRGGVSRYAFVCERKRVFFFLFFVAKRNLIGPRYHANLRVVLINNYVAELVQLYVIGET